MGKDAGAGEVTAGDGGGGGEATWLTAAEGNRISEVVVFSESARVTRRVRARARPGANRFRVEVEAFAPEAGSVQGAVRGAGEIAAVQYREVPVAEAPQEGVRALEGERRALVEKKEGLLDERKLVSRQAALLEAVSGLSGTELPPKARARYHKDFTLEEMLTYVRDRLGSLIAEERAINRQLEKLEREIKAVERKLKKARHPAGATRRAVEVLFDAAEVAGESGADRGLDQEVEVEVAYTVGRASWEPVYKVDVPADLSGLTLTLFARVEQASGEAWEGVDLTVSSAVPLAGGALPDLESWRIGMEPEPAPYLMGAVAAGAVEPRVRAKMMRSSEESAFAALEEAPDLVEPAAYAQAEERSLPLACEYTLPAAVTLPSGGDEALLPLFTRQPGAKFFGYTVPAADPLAYLVAEAPAGGDLLAGRLNVHFAGRFVGSTELGEKRAGEDLLVNLGAERSVRVRRNKVTDRKTESFFGVVDRTSVARELVFSTVVENLKDQPVKVRLIDRIPVSETDKVVVKGVEFKPEPTVRDEREREGVMRWEFEVAPGGSAEVRVRFFVKHPADRPVQL